mgnify:CR=1 FL=1
MHPTARVAMAALVLAAGWCTPAGAAKWSIQDASSSLTRSHCFRDSVPSCWVTYTDRSMSYTGYFSSEGEASAACSGVLDGQPCRPATTSAGMPLFEGGWLVTCPGGVNQYGLCVFTLRRFVAAYVPTLVVEQDVERPPNCQDTGRRFGNPVDGLSGEKLERVMLLHWSSLAAPLGLNYRSGRFARQFGAGALPGNNIAGLPGGAGSVGLGMQDDTGHRPFGRLWTHDLDSRLTPLSDGARLSRLQGGGGLTFRGLSDGSPMLPPPDQSDRVHFVGGGGAHWRHRDPRSLRTNDYSATGMLVHTVHADGTGRQWLSYSDASTPRTVAAGPDRLLSFRDALGRQLRVAYHRDASGLATDLVRDLTDDQGERIVFDHDSTGRLVSVQWPDGTAQRFTYDAMLPWALAARIDEAGVPVGNWTWDATSGLVTSVSGADGVQRHVLRFATPPRITVTEALAGRFLRRKYSWRAGAGAEVTLPNGSAVALGAATRHGSLKLTQRSQPAGVGCDASLSSMVLDANGNAKVKDDFAGARTCHAYDPARNLELVRVEGLGKTASCTALLADGAVLPPGARKTTTRWHPVWPMPEVIASAGRIETRVYNDRPDPFQAGAVASCMPWLGGGGIPVDNQPAALCRRVERATTDSNGSKGLAGTIDVATLPRDERWTYNQHGQLLSHDGPRTDVADVTTWAYHPVTTANAREGDLAEVRNGLGQATRFLRWSPTGLLLSFSDANGVRTELAYDRRQRLANILEAAGTPWARQTVQVWDARGLLARTEQPSVMTGTAALPGGSAQGRITRYDHDRAHRLVGVFNASGQGESYRLDASGNVTSRSIHHGDDVNRPPTVEMRDFDALDRAWRLWTMIGGVPQATELAHDAMGRLSTVQRPMVSAHGDTQPPKEQRRYDALGRLAQIDTSTLGPLRPTVLSNTPAGDVASVTSPAGARFEFTTDGLGQLRRTRSPDAGEALHRYDAAGNLTGSTDARGVTTSHDYDALNRRILTRRLAASGVDASEEVRFTWDSNPGAPMPCSNGIGRLCRIDDGASTQHLAYDAFGNLVEKLTVELGQTHRQTYAWDAERRLIASSDGGGSTWLSRDGDGHARTVVTSLSGQPSTLVSLEAMRANGDAGQRVLGNGVTLQRVHDSSGAVQAMIDRVRSVATTPCASPAACAARASGAR